MNTTDLKFRFIVPQWQKINNNIVPCLVPDEEKAKLSMVMLGPDIKHANIFGFVFAEELLLANMFDAENKGQKSFYEKACEMIGSKGELPSFLNEYRSNSEQEDDEIALGAYLAACA